MKDDLLWIYEGLTQYIGEFLAARSGLRTQEDYREALARVAAYLDNRPGRSWRSLEDTAVAASFLYDAPHNWESWRRSVDFYDEGWLIWLDADTLIRQQSHGQKSLDDFCRRFYGPPDSSPKVVPYTLDDVIAALNATVPYDWRGFFNARVYEINPHASDRWNRTRRLAADLQRSGKRRDARARERGRNFDLSFLAGHARSDWQRRRKWPISRRDTRDAGGGGGARARHAPAFGQWPRIHARRTYTRPSPRPRARNKPIVITADNGGFVLTYNVQYHGGERYPHLVRNNGAA